MKLPIKISIAVPGTFHAFDVAYALFKKHILEKIYTFSDFLRVIKWKKGVPLSKIFFFKFPLIKKGKMTRINGDIKISHFIKADSSNVIVSFAGIAENIFSTNKNKLKVLDIDHFNWDEKTCDNLKGNSFKYLDTSNPLNENDFIMQYSELTKEYSLRGEVFSPDYNSSYRECRECEMADIVMVPVSFVKATLCSAGLPKNKILVNPYGYDEEVFYSTPNKLFPDVVMYGGTISRRKGWFYLKNILQYYENTSTKFIIAGGIEPALRNEVYGFFARTSKNIQYLGPLRQKKLAYYMRNVGVFIFPSVLEGFGMPILQALASGTLAIVSQATCGYDLIRQGLNGYVINKQDTRHWLEKIEQLLLDKEKILNMGHNAAKSVVDLTWDRYIDRLVKRILTE